MKEHRIKIIADINSIYSGQVDDIKDLVMQLSETGVDAVTLQWYIPKDDTEEERAKRVTERELYMLKAFTELVNIEFIPLINYKQVRDSVTQKILIDLKVENYLCDNNYEDIYMEDIEWNFKTKFYIADTIPIKNYPTFDYLNHFGFIDKLDGITASIIAICRGAKYIVKSVINVDDGEIKGGIGFGELKELCDFRNSIEKILV